jgi:predicted metal-dependent hydrolase
VSVALEVVRHPQARRAKLSVDPASGRTRLVLPPRASLKRALAWAETQAEWISQQHRRLPDARPFVPGAILPFDDAALTIEWAETNPRRVARSADLLIVGGPADTIARRVEAWLKREALRLLTDDTAFYAARADVTVARVSVGDPRGRWGSCASSGVIRYSWRLVLAPSAVRRATAAHEVAHRVHMNHSPAFHALVAELYGSDPTPHRAWLKSHGAGLHWFGRSSSGAASRES